MKREVSESEREPDGYFEVFNSLIVQYQSEWSQMPEVVHLSLKALSKHLYEQDEHQSDIKQQINQLKLSVNQLQLNKASKREVERQFEDTRMLLNKHQLSPPPSEPDERSASVDYKFRRDEGLDRTMIAEVKTIALALIDERIAHSSQLSQRKVQQQFNLIVSDLRKELDQTINRIKDLTANRGKQEAKEQRDSYKDSAHLHHQLQTELRNLNDELKSIRTEATILGKNIQQKVDRDVFEEQIRLFRNRPQQPQRSPSYSSEIDSLKRIVEELLVKKLDQKEFVEFKQKTSKALTEKVKLQEVEEIVKSFQSELTNQLNEARSEIRRLEKNFTKQIKSVETLQASQAQLPKPRKQTSPSSKKTNSSISEIKSSLHRVERKIHERLLEMEPAEHNSCSDLRDELAKQWAKIQQELEERERKLCETIEQTLETNRNSTRPSRRPTVKDSETELALRVLCKQLVLGKWTCRSTPLVSRMIPWELQLNNTNSECFVWQPDNTSILVESPGLYRLEVAYFSVHRSDLVVLVNGQKVMVVYSKEQQRINRKHPNGMIAGTTAVQIIVMPARGRLAVEVSSNNSGEAYLGLTRI